MAKRELLNSLLEVPSSPHVVTVGSFDGVHRGHQFLLDRVTGTAGKLGVSSLAITFEPLPAEVLRPDLAPARVSTIHDRIEQMFLAGIDRIVLLEFDQDLASQSADDFLEEVCRHARPQAIVVGEDFAFGHKRQGNVELLARRSEELGYALDVVQRHNPDHANEWSSSAVREAVGNLGDIATGRAILGRPFRLAGTVVNGDHRGRTLGYPTANLNVATGLLVPADGIYAAYVSTDSDTDLAAIPALVYIGTRPTFGGSSRVVEAFLLDYDEDLYGTSLTIDFLDRIRGDRAFDSADELIAQMKRDEASGRQIFERDASATS